MLTMHARTKNSGLNLSDCIFLHSEFEQQAALLFPFPATVRLYAADGNMSTYEKDPWPSFLSGYEQGSLVRSSHSTNRDNKGDKSRGHQAGTEPGLPINDCLGYHNGQLCCPLQLADGGAAYLVFSGSDQALLKKVSRDWLRTFQRQINTLLWAIQKGYRDPETGLFNRRALNACLQQPFWTYGGKEDLTLYLLHLSFVRRSITGTFHRIQYFADLLATINNQGIFYLGQGVYALLLHADDQAAQRILAHRLQKFLRREKLQRVHIAFGDYAALGCANEQEATGETRPLESIFSALALAEQRGPFGICDVRVLAGQAMHPFVMPSQNVLRKLQRLWKGRDSFCLALFVASELPEGEDGLASLLCRLDADCPRRMSCLAVSEKEAFVLLLNTDIGRAEQCIRALHHGINDQLNVPVAAGYCSYPDLDQCKKIESVRRCYKALMHGRFYGPDALVCFDHVSLNVSGDWYFDQGDFRQAVREYREGLKRAPGEKNLLNSLGVALIEMKQTSRAMTIFEQVLEQEPDNHMALVNLGYACLQKGWRKRALKFFEKAHAVQYHAGIDGVDVLRQLSRLYIFFARFTEALRILNRWHQYEESGQDFLFYQLLGRAHFETGSPGQAMKALQKALRIHPRDAESMSLLGLLYVQENEGADAGESLLRKAISLDRRQAMHWYRLAVALKHMNRSEEALAVVRQSLRRRKDFVDARLLQVELLIRQQKMHLARRQLDRVLRQEDLSNRQKRLAEKLFSDFFDKSIKET